MEELTSLIQDDTDMSVINICFKDDTTELTDSQLEAIKETLIKEKVIWAVEQGLGKTYLSVALCNILYPYIKENKKKIILCVPQSKLEDFRRHLVEKTFMKVIAVSGSEADITLLRNKFNGMDCIITTPSAWNRNLSFNCLMYNRVEDIYAMIYDEAAGINDRGYLHFIKIAKDYATFVAMANATPVGGASHFSQGKNSALDVLYNLLSATGRVDNIKSTTFYRKYTDLVGKDKSGFDIRKINPVKIQQDFGQYIINFNRTDIGANTFFDPCIFHRVYTTKVQEGAMKNIRDGDTKRDILYRPSTCVKYGIDSVFQISAITEIWNIINQIPATNNTIVYAKNTDTLSILRRLFEDFGKRKTFILDGKSTQTPEAKLEVENMFNNTPGSIILTNIEKGSNLGAATNVIVYDAPSDVLQYIFRGIRGSKSKTIQLDWIYYPAYDDEPMINSLMQMKEIMQLLNRENPLYNLLLTELKTVYPGHERLRGL